MTVLASLRECTLHVIRIGRALEVFQVARHTRCIGQVVVAVDVALRTRQRRMRAGQRESSRAVVEIRVSPRCGAVASLAGCRHFRLHMVGVGRALVILHVARIAIGWRTGKLAVHVTLSASCGQMRSGQWKLRKRVVIESRRLPRGGVVATLTSLREARLHVIRVARFLEVRQVTSHASGRRAGELSANVAGCAVQRGMRSDKREAGHLQVIEFRSEPGVSVVTLFASNGKVTGCVARLRVLIILGVTRVALRRQSLKLPNGGTLVAGFAI